MERKLDKLLEAARKRRMTEEEVELQRVSFAFGNAPHGDSGSMESVKAASTILKASTAEK